MIELKGKCNKDCIIYTDEIEQEAYSLIQGILDEKPSEGVPIRIMPDTHAGKDIVIGFTMPMTEYVNPNWIGTDIGCFTEDTKIRLTDGRSLSFLELIEEHNNGIKNYCYSINKSGNVVISKINLPIRTKTVDKICKVYLDNGEIIKCTVDHKFMMRSGEYKEAYSLNSGDSLMPLYIDKAFNVENVDHDYNKSHLKDYLVIYNPRHDNYRFIHYLSDEYNKRKSLLRTPNETSWVRHHIDFNKYNNNPDNVARYGYIEHWKLHSENVSITNKLGTTGFLKAEEIHPGLLSRSGSIGMSKNWENEEFRERNRIRQSKRCKDPYFSKRSLLIRIVKILDILREKNLEINKDNYTKEKLLNITTKHHPSYEYAVKFSRENCGLDLEELYTNSKFITNHKVKFIEIIDSPNTNVYCLVNQEYDNFALDSGVFVHNCSVSTYKLSLKDEDINLPLFDTQIRDIIPMGTNIRKKSILDEKEFLKSFKRNLSSFHSKYTKHSGINYDLPTINEKWLTQMFKRIGIEPEVFYNSIGTLGGGNHFIEIGMNNKGEYFLTIHTGSRNFGLKVAKYHTNQSKLQKDSSNEEYAKRLDDLKNDPKNRENLQNLIKELKNELNLGTSKKYLKGEFAFNYLVDMVIAQTYAQFNHDSIQREICKKLKCTATDMIRSVHNYIDMNDFIIRKGAIRAYEGELCVIPFNMRDGLLICKGKGNDSWNNSAPHGAGRVLARGKAKNTLSLEEFEEKMKGIYSTSVVKETLDESPMAYKDSEIIEILIDPTVEIVDRIKPILNIKSID